MAKLFTVCGPEEATTFEDASWKVGGLLSGLTVSVKVRGRLVIIPPWAVPPLSRAAMLIVAVPFVCGTSEKKSEPFRAIDGRARRTPDCRSCESTETT